MKTDNRSGNVPFPVDAVVPVVFVVVFVVFVVFVAVDDS